MTTICAVPAAAQSLPIPFRLLLRAEWQKTIGTRAIRWLLAATALITIGALAVPLLFPHDITQSRASYLIWAALGLSRLLPVVLMLTMTAEWSQRTAMTTFTQEPRRGRVLAAKILTGQAVSLAGEVSHSWPPRQPCWPLTPPAAASPPAGTGRS